MSVRPGRLGKQDRNLSLQFASFAERLKSITHHWLIVISKSKDEIFARRKEYLKCRVGILKRKLSELFVGA